MPDEQSYSFAGAKEENLEYKEFSKKIYDDAKACITNSQLECSSLKKSASTHIGRRGRLMKRFYGSVHALLHSMPHQWLDIVLSECHKKLFIGGWLKRPLPRKENGCIIGIQLLVDDDLLNNFCWHFLSLVVSQLPCDTS